MIVLLSQTKLPDSSNPLSDIVGAVHDGEVNLINHEKIDFGDIVPDEAYIREDHRVFIPYLYKVATLMRSYPDCIEIFNMDFSETSTVKDPIIYVNFKEKESVYPYSKKIFHINNMI